MQASGTLLDTLVGVSPAGRVSVTTEPVDESGPLLAMLSVQLAVPPALTVAASAVLVMTRSATGPITNGARSELLSGS